MRDSIKDIDPLQLNDLASFRQVVVILLNQVEEQNSELKRLKEENRLLKDEINRLKGEHGRPQFKDKGGSSTSNPRSDKAKNSKHKKTKKGSKKGRVKIDEVKLCEPEASILPSDAVLKYYDEVIKQDVIFKSNNTLYKVAVYYSASEKKTYRGQIPDGYIGGYGLGLHSLSHLLHHYCDVTQGRLEALYKSLGICISSGSISNILLSAKDWVLEEQQQILRSGIASSAYTQIDSTKSVEKGVRKATQIICGQYFSVFYTQDSKSRMNVLRALLGNPKEGLYAAYNEVSIDLMLAFGVSIADRATLSKLYKDSQKMTLADFELNIEQAAPHIYAKKNIFARIKESMTLGFYHTQLNFPVVEYLLSDDAPEYTKIALNAHALCWLHDARYYKKLIPHITIHQQATAQILDQYWVFYQKLLDFKKMTPEEQLIQKQVLAQDFEQIFSQKTNYFQLNRCLERTYKNRKKLLVVLDNPALPLHNNTAELGARRIVRKRDISLHTWSPVGTQVRDAFMSIVQTAEKVGVCALDYIKDRVSKCNQMPHLAHCVTNAYA